MSAAATVLFEGNFTETRRRTSTEFLRQPVSVLRLVALLADERDEDDHGPSQFAFWKAFIMVSDAISILGEDFASSPTVDSQGGIRITWRRGDRQVKLICPATRGMPMYIYEASPEGNAITNEGVTASMLADKLYWLINRESAAR
ncbi:MAG TPA: hypothetical protein VMT32_19535 [Bryobacteraceae bacterium]|nr:hypothetical protein [Bryobacteraceae bacterium]